MARTPERACVVLMTEIVRRPYDIWPSPDRTGTPWPRPSIRDQFVVRAPALSAPETLLTCCRTLAAPCVEIALAEQTADVECRKDPGVVDEIPGAYKDIADVMARQADLVEIVHHLKQVVCVKG